MTKDYPIGNAKLEYAFPHAELLEPYYNPPPEIEPSNFLYLDVEVYPNFFCVGLKLDGVVCTYEYSRRANHMEGLWNDLFQNYADTTIVTFNGFFYDLPMMNFLFETVRTNKELKAFSDALIRNDKNTKRYIYNKNCFFKGRNIDLMKALGNNNRVGLKRIGIHLKYPNLIELPYHHATALSPPQMDKVLAYNIHDLNITEMLHEKQKTRYEMTAGVSKQYGIDVLDENDTNIAKAFIKAELKKLGFEHFDLNTIHNHVNLSECVPDISFQNKKLQTLLQKIKETVIWVDDKTKALKYSVTIGDIKYDIGVGGLHGYDKKKSRLFYEQNENYKIVDGDVTSYYPCLEMEHEIYPEHIGRRILSLIRTVFNERKESKPLRDVDAFHKVREYVLKIVMNAGFFGLMGEKHSFLYDLKAFYSVTLHGQLFLLKWIEMLTEAEIKIISANTDGITVWLHKEQEVEYYRIADEWMKLTHLNLEFEEFEKMALLNVNNYTGLTKKGKIKDKGLFLLNKRLNQDPSTPVISRAAVENILYGKSIEETINETNDIHEFLITKRNGDDWVLHVNGQPQQKTNRYYASLNGSYFFSHEVLPQAAKEKTLFGEAQQQGRTRAEIKGQLLTLANDISGHEDCSNVDKNYYIAETYKLVNGFIMGGETSKQQNEKPQQSHFGFY